MDDINKLDANQIPATRYKWNLLRYTVNNDIAKWYGIIRVVFTEAKHVLQILKFSTTTERREAILQYFVADLLGQKGFSRGIYLAVVKDEYCFIY